MACLQCSNLLVDCGSPNTLIRADMWEQVRRPHNKLLIDKTKQFQGVTRDGLRVFGLVHLKLEFGSLHIDHQVVVVDKIAHKCILGNDFLVAHRCDILNSEGTIVFGCKPVPHMLFRSTINLICPVMSQARIEIEPYEETIIPGLLDSYRSYDSAYDPNQTLLFEPRKNKLMQLLVVARVVVNFTSAVVPILVSNISFELVTIPKGKVIVDDTALIPNASIRVNCRSRQIAWLLCQLPTQAQHRRSIQWLMQWRMQTRLLCLSSVCYLSAFFVSTPGPSHLAHRFGTNKLDVSSNRHIRQQHGATADAPCAAWTYSSTQGRGRKTSKCRCGRAIDITACEPDNISQEARRVDAPLHRLP